MAVALSELPPTLAEAVRRARARLPQSEGTVCPLPVITDPSLREWIREYSASGDLDRAIQEAAADDPDIGA